MPPCKLCRSFLKPRRSTLEQRLWLNGYLAGLAGREKSCSGECKRRAGDGSSATATVPLLILFGSQTGTAEKLARQIAKESKPRGCNSRVVDAAEHSKIDWSKETNLLVVTSTYGDGDMPDNAQAFWDWLQTDAAKSPVASEFFRARARRHQLRTLLRRRQKN